MKDHRSRAMSRRVLTSAFSVRAWVTMARATAAWASGGAACSDSARAISADDGVRTSCEMALSNISQAFRFHLDHRLLRHLDLMHPLERDRGLVRRPFDAQRRLGDQ